MSLDTLTDALKNWLGSILHSDWLSTLITAVIIAVATAVVAHLVTVFLRKVLKSNKGPLPAVSIFVNIGRVTVWVVGLCVILSSCFNVNVGAAVTALGIGGIAVSLGFQDTLSNLIGGLQIIMTKLIEPGDRIKVSSYEGMVTDVTWRHTTIMTARGEKVVIPNSVINTSALVKLAPEDDIRLDISIDPGEEALDDVVAKMQDEVNLAVGKVAVLMEKAQINVTGKTDRGYQAMLTFATGKGTKRSVAIDTALKAIAGSGRRTKQHKKPTMKSKLARKGTAIANGDNPVAFIENEIHKLEEREEQRHAARDGKPHNGREEASGSKEPDDTTSHAKRHDNSTSHANGHDSGAEQAEGRSQNDAVSRKDGSHDGKQ